VDACSADNAELTLRRLCARPRPLSLVREIGRHLVVPEFRDRMASLGADPSPSTPEAFAALIKAEAAKWQKVIRAIGLEHSQ
jgi:tripartite-type tricarboxylate transporter receptor subunit TctC